MRTTAIHRASAIRPSWPGLIALAILAATPVAASAQSAPGDDGPPVPRRYGAPRLPAPPVIDGRLDDEVWNAVPWTEPFVDIRGTGHPEPRFETRARIAWDERALYVAARLEEPHLWATLTRRDAIVYREHDFEVFIDPEGDGLDYYELEINALGTEFDLRLNRPYHAGGQADIDWDMVGLVTAVWLDGTLNDPSDVDRGWSVEVAIPWTALPGVRGPPRPGEVWRINFSRVQWPLVIEDGAYRKEREPVDWSDHPEDNWVWSPQGRIDMHRPGRWGYVRFEAGTSGIEG